MNKITHQAIESVYLDYIYCYSKWDTGEITRQKIKMRIDSKGFSWFDEELPIEVKNVPNNLNWIDVRKVNE